MIAIIGLGYVGLTTALGFAHKGYDVNGFDIDVERLRALKKGVVPFSEPFLDKFLKKYIDKKFFVYDTIEKTLEDAEVIFYCVGTPSSINGVADLGFIKKALKSSLTFIKKHGYKVLVVKSTVPPSTTDNTLRLLIEKSGFTVGEDIGLVNNPEFFREGSVWEDFINPDRIVIGESDKKSGDIVEQLYNSFNAPIVRVSLTTAEFIKYLSNTLLSTLISFSNEMSMVADLIGDVDIRHSFEILHLDKRWIGTPAAMTSYIYPGCGFGGSCLPKDTRTFYKKAKDRGYEASLLREVLSVNDKTKEYMVNKTLQAANKNDYIGILGLSFKPESNDVRVTPAKDIIEMLIEKGVNKIIAYDPAAINNFRKEYDFPIVYANTFEEVIHKSNVVLLLTAWKEFKIKKSLLKGKKIIDGRYFL